MPKISNEEKIQRLHSEKEKLSKQIKKLQEKFNNVNNNISILKNEEDLKELNNLKNILKDTDLSISELTYYVKENKSELLKKDMLYDEQKTI